MNVYQLNRDYVFRYKSDDGEDTVQTVKAKDLLVIVGEKDGQNTYTFVGYCNVNGEMYEFENDQVGTVEFWHLLEIRGLRFERDFDRLTRRKDEKNVHPSSRW